LWQALNPDARDFRLETIGNGFVPSDLRDEGGHTYFANVPRPERGFTAYFIELTYSTLHGDLFTVTSGVRVTPDVLPYRLPHRLAHSDTL
jgi:PhoPQ-activated pathogenicity-related protein